MFLQVYAYIGVKSEINAKMQVVTNIFHNLKLI